MALPGTATVTINGVPCYELVADLEENYDILQGPSMRKGYVCAWSQRFQLAQGLLGLNSATHIGGLMTINTPMQYPELSTAYAKSINIVGVGSPTQGTHQTQYTNAIVYANFSCMPWSFSLGDGNFADQQIDPATPLIYCKQNIQFSTQPKSIDGLGLVFASSGNKKKGFFAMPLFQADIQLTFLRLSYFPAQQIFTAGLNPLNSAMFLNLPVGTVLFNGGQDEESRDELGNITRDLTYSFTYRTLRWDYDWDQAAAAFNQIQIAGSGTGIIGMSDLNSLIPSGYLA